MLNIIGGIYIEKCREPNSYEIFGSGLRAAIALSGKGFEIQFSSCVGEDERETVESNCNTFDIATILKKIEKTVSFIYDHPLAKPSTSYCFPSKFNAALDKTVAKNILYYGLIEASATVDGDYVVYDPQNWVSFKKTKSRAKHLAIILNKKEALFFFGNNDCDDLKEIGKALLLSERAEVIVIKNGSKGALVIDSTGEYEIPVFKTNFVWPIGSGDIFSAVFAWKWIEEKISPKEAAFFASAYTAYYCETKDIPLPSNPPSYEPIPITTDKKKIYLAGPFFTMGERWLIKELRIALKDFGNLVFSPFHDVGFGPPLLIAEQDIEGIVNADVLLAVVSGLDSGTLFEIGYAKALNKKVVVLSENVKSEDLLMLIGTGCDITHDFCTAVYKASW